MGRDPSGKRRRPKVLARTKREALRRQKALEADLTNGLSPDRTTMTVRELFDPREPLLMGTSDSSTRSKVSQCRRASLRSAVDELEVGQPLMAHRNTVSHGDHRRRIGVS